jgi:LasA protease
MNDPKKNNTLLGCVGIVVLMIMILGCVMEASGIKPWVPPSSLPISANASTSIPQAPAVKENPSSTTPAPAWKQPTRQPDSPFESPTPDPPHVMPTLRSASVQYTVKQGDTLRIIAARFGVDLSAMIEANQLVNPDLLSVGQNLVIPPPKPGAAGPGFKIIPDSELVYGPTTVGFDIAAFIQSQKGYLVGYSETVDGDPLNSAQIIQRIAYQYSVNPRLLLAFIEYQSGWVTNSHPSTQDMDYPLGLVDASHKGLARQLNWAANALNQGYYLWKVNGLSAYILSDGTYVPVNNSINAGTAGVQNALSLLYSKSDWERAVSSNGLYKTFSAFFGYPFDYTLDPLVPHNLSQPEWILPFEPGVSWSFTGGPHGGWGEGSAWAALDFAPPGEGRGCVTSDAWVTAAAAGKIVRSHNGEVMEDLDGDGYEQTGWALLYMHIEARDRVAVGTVVHPGDRIGHPSCEGGISSGTHTHLARRYNGEWIPADGPIPFNLSGWISKGDGTEYDGTLSKNGQVIEAWADNRPENKIHR